MTNYDTKLISPRMIEAGMKLAHPLFFEGFVPDTEEDGAEIVAAIYTAMHNAHLSSLVGDREGAEL